MPEQYESHEGGAPDGHLLVQLAALDAPTLAEVVAFADAVGFPGADGLAIHWEGVGPIARPNHAQCAQQVEDIRRYHTQQAGYSDIAYSNLVCTHGGHFTGRGWDRQSAATCNGTYNRRFWATCAMIGTGDTVTPELKRALREDWDEAQRRGARSVICHRDACATACPGDDLCAWVHAGLPTDTVPVPPPPPVVLDEEQNVSDTLVTWTADNKPGEWHYASAEGDLWHRWGPRNEKNRELLCGPNGDKFGAPITVAVEKVTAQRGTTNPERIDLFAELATGAVAHLWRANNSAAWSFEMVP